MSTKQKIEGSGNKFGLIKFFREVKAEVKRITWPSKEETKKNILAVLIFTAIFIIVVGSMDLIFKNLFELMFGLK